MHLQSLFSPKSILVIGVSESHDNLARQIVINLKEFRFPGDVHMLGLREGSLLGGRILTSFDDLPDGIELAVLLTPARTIPDMMDRCGRKGIRHAAVLSGGFKELGTEGAALEDRLLEVARGHGIRFAGPNGVGLLSPSSGLGAVFAPVSNCWTPGGVSVAAQSGGVGFSYLYGLVSENLGLARFASVGNKLDLDETDYVEAFGNDPETRVISLYLESISRGRAFFDVLRSCPKPVIIQKTNRTELGRRTAFSHTAAMAADDRIVDAAIRQAGGIRVASIHEMMDGVKAMMLPDLKGQRLGIISRSGGHAVIAADFASDAGFELPPFPEEFLEGIGRSYVNEVIQRQNPLDLGDLFDFEAYSSILEGALALPDVDAVVMVHEYFSNFDASESRKLVPKAAKLSERYGKPAILVMISDEPETAQLKQMYSFPFFTSVGSAFKALSAARRRGQKPTMTDGNAPAHALPEGVPEKVRSLGRGEVLHGGFEVLTAAGFPVPEQRLVRTLDGMEGDLPPFPLAAKVISARAAHKSDAGGVLLGLGDRAAFEAAFEDLHTLFGPFGPGEGVLAQSMAGPGSEWIVGGLRDPNFGPVVMVGAGGILVELLKDTAIRLAPVTLRETREMLGELKASRLLDGVRGSAPGDREALAGLVQQVGQLMSEYPEIEEMDLNPCIVHEEGLTVVDVRIKLTG
ncbi:MAG: acetate--CoA ligase family protein [Deltaproteobacteria bacterium]|nr:acetate--CoA ligase family protein [Deltaproteobacteria bacterium]